LFPSLFLGLSQASFHHSIQLAGPTLSWQGLYSAGIATCIQLSEHCHQLESSRPSGALPDALISCIYSGLLALQIALFSGHAVCPRRIHSLNTEPDIRSAEYSFFQSPVRPRVCIRYASVVPRERTPFEPIRLPP